MKTVPLVEVAEVIRSKNAGPFLLTLDVVYRRPQDYLASKQAGVLDRHRVARLYGVPTERVLAVTYYDPSNAIKMTLIREIPSGARGDTDVYGAQQHAPLLEVQVPVAE